ncbi:hypothetical protein DSL72_004351 [Monilinia vaccinii-corymbosi]|uniref:Uncharacterized protein n=1 Tax=Monilinia vaccinii-corymbosi TaxID=61207 RepID=A0A8A3NWE7_9HELO|nr:hypothetical protein DSL72_004351 [Monilinia vaccinii-corymbosi]
MNLNLEDIWGELLRSISDNEATLRGLLEGRAEIEKARDLNYMFMSYLSIVHNISTIKMGGGWIDSRVRIPSDLEFIEMLKLLMRYTSDLTAWVEDHDRSGAPWAIIKDFDAESLLEVDAQCQRWWFLADVTTLNQRIGPFTMHPSLPPTQEDPLQFETTEAPQTPALPFTKHQSLSTTSSNLSRPSAATPSNGNQMPDVFPPVWNDVAESGFPSSTNFAPLRRLDHRLSNSGSSEPEEPFEQYHTTPVPSTPRLEQQGFTPSPSPSLALQNSANKQNGFFQPMPPPARKIAVPRLQKLGAFEPLLPPTQNSIIRSFPAIGEGPSSEETKKRTYMKASAETLGAKQRKRQAIGSEIPHQNPVSTEYEVFKPDLESSSDTVSNGSPGSALTSPGDFYNANEPIILGLTSVNSTAILREEANERSPPYTPNLHHAAINPDTDWDDTLSATTGSNQIPENAGLGISSPPMDSGFSHFKGPVLNTMPFDSSMQSSRMIGSNLHGTSHQMTHSMYNDDVGMENIGGMNQLLDQNQSNVFNSRYENLLKPRKAPENEFMDGNFR